MNTLLITNVCLSTCRNSEIYNHQQIRKELLSDSKVSWTGSDSIVLGYLYEKFGPSAKVLEAMDGIFCGVLYDEGKDEYFAFRDHMGICPLYYGKGSDGSTWFASEMRALQEVCDAELQCFPPVRLIWPKICCVTVSFQYCFPFDLPHVFCNWGSLQDIECRGSCSAAEPASWSVGINQHGLMNHIFQPIPLITHKSR